MTMYADDCGCLRGRPWPVTAGRARRDRDPRDRDPRDRDPRARAPQRRLARILPVSRIPRYHL